MQGPMLPDPVEVLATVPMGDSIKLIARSEALKRFIVEEGVGKDGRYWKLAQSLSALYSSGSEEKRWVDDVLARKNGLGF